MDNKDADLQITQNSKRELNSAIVWIVAGAALVAYGIIGLFNVAIPGVEELVVAISSVDGTYILLAAFLAVFIEGLYVIGSFFPGSTLVVLLAILSQLAGPWMFAATIVTIFIGWCLAGAVNILLARSYRSRIALLSGESEYKIQDRFWTTWFPTFRANYEVAQVIDGGDPLKVFYSSVRVKLWASGVMALAALSIPLFIDVNELSNEEGFASLLVVAIISFVVGGMKLRNHFSR